MKKTISLTLISMLLLCSLTACGFIENIFDKLEDKAEAIVKVEEMMAALTENAASKGTTGSLRILLIPVGVGCSVR